MRKFFCLLLFPFSLFAQSKHITLMDSLMQAQVTVNKFNGNVLVAKSGEILYQKAFGYRNYTTKETLDNNSVFDLASVSKQFTAMAILLLKEKGKLQLSDSLRKFFPALPYTNVTIRQLLTHTSGIPDYEDAMNQKWDRKKIAFNSDLIQFLATEKIPFLFLPGQRWAYSNTGYALLASIVEKVSAVPFGQYMKDNIFSPLGMTNTRIYNTRRSTKDVIPNYAYGFVFSESQNKYVLPDSVTALDFVRYLDGVVGDGVVNSTTGDLLKWDRALKNNRLLPEATQREQLSGHALADSIQLMSYGYGIMVLKNKFGTNLAHPGGWPGYVTFMNRVVEDDLTIIVLSNNGSSSPTVSNQLLHIVKNEPVIFPYLHKEVKIDTSVLNKFQGKYVGISIIELKVVNGKLYRRGGRDIELKPESADKFFYADGSDRQIQFEMGAGGVEKAWIISGGIKSELKKIQ